MSRPGVGVGIIVLRDGKFLVGQRKGSHGSGAWSVPGGWMEFGESFEAASAREIIEETGLTIQNIRFAGLTNNIFLDEKVHSLTVWMTAEWDGGEPEIREPNKFIEQKWVDFDTLPSPLFKALDLLIESEFLPMIKQRLAASKAA